MNLLITDDETITREGLFRGADFEHLGIDSVKTAADGLQALELCRDFRPDILLTDVRMPRMDGISLAETLQQRFPDMSIVFMSGYSDKEYLKAAIKLRAVSYIEKPIRLSEVNQVLAEAAEAVLKKRENARLRDLSRRQSSAAAAQRLTQAGTAVLVSEKDFPVDPDRIRFCVTALIRCYTPVTPQEEDRIEQILSEVLPHLSMSCIHVLRQPSLCILQLFSEKCPSEAQQQYLADRVAELLGAVPLRFHLVFGKPAAGPWQLYDSYNTAIITLQRAFFYPEGTALRYESSVSHGMIADISLHFPEGCFRDLLLKKDGAPIRDYLDSLLPTLSAETGLLPNQVREFYYRLFRELKQAATVLHIDLPAALRYSLWERISGVSSVQMLQQMLEEQTADFLKALTQSVSVSSPVYLIRSYISGHLSDPNLSIKAISDEVHLSTSYVCTIFKAETGDTLTHYITELRMKKARELLMDPRNRISDISVQVGFSDSNYFSKAFKKAFGLSPSEFRDSLQV